VKLAIRERINENNPLIGGTLLPMKIILYNTIYKHEVKEEKKNKKDERKAGS